MRNHHLCSYTLSTPCMVENPLKQKQLFTNILEVRASVKGASAPDQHGHSRSVLFWAYELHQIAAISFGVSYGDGRQMFWDWIWKQRRRRRTPSSTTCALYVFHTPASSQIPHDQASTQWLWLNDQQQPPPPRMTRWELSLGGIEGVERAGIANGSHKRKMASLSQSNPRRMPAWSLLLDPGARGLNCQILWNCHRSQG